jgi:regulator of RNase E activity RraA
MPESAIHVFEIPRLPAEILAGYEGLEDLAGSVSDAMDELGMAGTIPSYVLPSNLPGKRVVGQAVTVLNHDRGGVPAAVKDGRNLMGEREAYNLAEPGDVVVIQGIHGASNMGGQSASLAHRSQCAAAIIDGHYRDPDSSRSLGMPIWARGVTPITGKWRLQTVAINGPVVIAGVQVNAGDLVVADESGVVFVPFAQAAAVLAKARHISDGDNRQKADIDRGVTLTQLTATKYK